jgi:hypothetical protein
MTSSVTIPWLGVLLAVVVAFVANFVWFGPKTFFPVWWRAIGKSAGDEPGAGQNMGVVFGLTVAASLVQALTLSWLLQAAAALYGVRDVSLGSGALVGFGVGVGIAAATSLGHRLFAGQGLLVWVLEVGGDILGLTLMGAVLSFWL